MCSLHHQESTCNVIGQKQWLVFHPKHKTVPDKSLQQLLAEPTVDVPGLISAIARVQQEGDASYHRQNTTPTISQGAAISPGPGEEHEHACHDSPKRLGVGEAERSGKKQTQPLSAVQTPDPSQPSQLKPSSSVGQLKTCTQQAGEILYLPAGWHHATVNLEMTVAVALVRAQSIEFLGPGGYLYKE
jgi:quercetin dioxygenase-like cupin family protein